ncbi:transient receptor potential cation channel subfamily V member 3-like isoform X2 [Ptychodera flava]|uniref:transient receptor potential cation channel subfamily V member 3-like isoform X2 n=1 Tax=Ptychodera flava TaxID=63121 RepID=UPI00396A0C8C
MDSSDPHKKGDRKKSRRKRVHPNNTMDGLDSETENSQYELKEKPKTNNALWVTESSKFKTPAIQEKNNAGQKVGEAVVLMNNVRKAGEKFKNLKTKRRKDFSADDKKGAKGQIDEYVPSDYTAQSNANRALISYFASLAKSDHEDDTIDLEFVETLVDSKANINCTDKHGQSILHEVARVWETDVAAFLIAEKGANVNQGDDFGRTPLHVAAAVDYPEMVNCLLDNGADLEALTNGEDQTPLHYAAKNDACHSLRALIKRGANLHANDFKKRSPLQVAAEGDRSETARTLLELGADPADIDENGQPALVLMVTKMPPVAREALDHFHRTDRANRKQFYDLHALEPVDPENTKNIWRTPMQAVVQYKQFDLIIHPIFQELISLKWRKYGRLGAWKQTIMNLIFILLWTVIGVTLPKDSDQYNFPQDIWRVVLEATALAFTLYLIIVELQEFFESKKKFTLWKQWKTEELLRDTEFCHPRWPQERKYIDREIEELNDMGPSYFSDSWNYFDWFVYILLLSCAIIHIVDILVQSSDDPTGEDILTKVYHRLFAITIIFLWLRLMKSCRAFRALGPFIVMLGKIVMDVVRFLYLYLEFWIPYCCAFWMIFGVTGEVQGMESFYGVAYSLFRITLVDEYDYEGMKDVDPVMADILCGTFLAVSAVLCLNLMIALLSDTFQRVYDNAQQNAAMQQAAIILGVEDGLSKKKKHKFYKYIKDSCNPLELYYDDDLTTIGGDDDLKKVTIQIKEELDDMKIELYSHLGIDKSDGEELDGMRESFKTEMGIGTSRGGANIVREIENLKEEIDQIKRDQTRAFDDVKRDFNTVLDMLRLLLKRQGKGGSRGGYGYGRGPDDDGDDGGDGGGYNKKHLEGLNDESLQRAYVAHLTAKELDGTRRGRSASPKGRQSSQMMADPYMDATKPPTYDLTSQPMTLEPIPPRPGTAKQMAPKPEDEKQRLQKLRKDKTLLRKRRQAQEDYLLSKQQSVQLDDKLVSVETPPSVSDQEMDVPVQHYTEQDGLVVHMSEMATTTPRNDLATEIKVKTNVLFEDDKVDVSEA